MASEPIAPVPEYRLPPPDPTPLTRSQVATLLLTAAASSSCGLAAELLLGGLASYLVGNHALAYGVAVGGFLAAMGVGSYLSQFVAPQARGDGAGRSQLLTAFVRVELAMAPAIALLPLGLFALFVAGVGLWAGLLGAAALLGILAGMEVPLLTRMLEHDRGLKDALAGVLALDYAGALVGAIAFPLVLLPVLGMFPAAAVIGAIPALMVGVIAQGFPALRRWRVVGWGLAAGLVLLAPLTIPLGDRLENNLYRAPIVYRDQSPYQRLILTESQQDVRLFLDGDLQFSSIDEYRYHEALVHPVLAAIARPPQRVLVLGAGDGLAVREVLKWPSVTEVILIELDPAVTKLARSHPRLTRLNQQSLTDPRVTIRQGDAFREITTFTTPFDAIIADFPDPDRDVLAKLYAVGFYHQLRSHLAPDGAIVTQASSPFFVPRAFNCVAKTLASAGFQVAPYRTDVPSFGPWGFVLGVPRAAAADPGDRLGPAQIQAIGDRWAAAQIATQFLTPTLLPALFVLPQDEQVDWGRIKVNRLSDPVLVQYHQDQRWNWY